MKQLLGKSAASWLAGGFGALVMLTFIGIADHAVMRLALHLWLVWGVSAVAICFGFLVYLIWSY